MRRLFINFSCITGIVLMTACGGGGGGNSLTTPPSGPSTTPTPTSSPTVFPTAPTGPQSCSGTKASVASPGLAPAAPSGITVPAGFQIQIIAKVTNAREVAALPNGDLLVGTNGGLFIVPNAESSGSAGAPVAFASPGDTPDDGVTFVQSSCTIYIGTQHAVYSIPYHDGQLTGTPVQIASVRTGGIPSGSDGDVHRTTSVAFAGGKLYAGVGSSCNACTEIDPTRASIQVMSPSGGGMTTRATRIRNPIALAVNPATGTLWAGGAGQDDLPGEHPYEFFDAVTLHPGVADYGWPECEENRHAYTSGANCSSTVQPLVEVQAYSTIIGASFYPLNQLGVYKFPSQYGGGIFLAAHGSWHDPSTAIPGITCASPAQVDFVPMNGDAPKTAVDWSDPTKQWQPFVSGFQESCSASPRRGRPTGVAVGSKGSLFIGDDQNGVIYRIRPNM